ncbi:tetratricopeptide repeat protein [Cognatilysobacter bugurensis]|uniref:tetratricopeptide repeat protein n=1 Tax=Cognatilysobacter bugurensis TaxID=543356 RepID=UPI003CCD7871
MRHELGDVLLVQGRYGPAARELEGYHRALVARHGAGHAELRNSHRALARVQRQRGEVGAAETSLREALAISRRGGDPDQVAEVQIELGELLHATGRDALARPLVQQAVALRRARHGEKHALTVAARRLLAEIDASLGTARAAVDSPLEGVEARGS